MIQPAQPVRSEQFVWYGTQPVDKRDEDMQPPEKPDRPDMDVRVRTNPPGANSDSRMADFIKATILMLLGGLIALMILLGVIEVSG